MSATLKRFLRGRIMRFACFLAVFVSLPPVSVGYDIGTGDVLDVQVSGEDDLSGTYPVSAEGCIILPLLGAVPVVNMKVEALTRLLRERLAADYLVNPHVAVFVKEYRSRKVAILGDVPSPGFHFLKNDSTLLSLLTDAGLKLASGDVNIIITRTNQAGNEKPRDEAPPTVLDIERLLSPWQKHNPIPLSGGERIFVKSGAQGKVIVSGKVQSPGVVSLTEGLTLLEAINKAGGLAEFGNLSAVRVVRQTPKGSDVKSVDLEAVMKGDGAKDMVLKDGDIVVVPRRWF